MANVLNSWWKCFWSIWKHKYYVYLGSRMVGGIPWYRILWHDMSKFHPKEFFGYARKFYGDGEDQISFERAWLHHQNSNDHHPEYFITRSADADDRMIYMPEVCAREMVADWIGAEITYGGSTDMTGWLEKNLIGKLNLIHSLSGKLVVAILKDTLGYDTDSMLKERY